MSANNPVGFLGGMILEVGAVIAVLAFLWPQPVDTARRFVPTQSPADLQPELRFSPVQYPEPLAGNSFLREPYARAQPAPAPQREIARPAIRELARTPYDEHQLRVAQSRHTPWPGTIPARDLQPQPADLQSRVNRTWHNTSRPVDRAHQDRESGYDDRY